MKIVLFESLRALAALVVCLAVTGCGGGSGYGGGGGDPPPLPQPGSLQFEPGNMSVDEHAGTVQLTITRTAGSDGAVSVAVASGDATAIAGQDYTALNTTVNFAAGDAVAKTVTVSIADDGQTEADEGFVVVLLEPTGGAQRGPTRVAAVTIRDNDPAPAAPVAQVSAATKQLTFTWASVPGATSYRLLQNPDGASGFTRVGADYPSDAVSALTALVQAIGNFKASNTGVNDSFGELLALSADGSTLAVGAPFEDSDATGVSGNEANEDVRSAGAVYVFTRVGMQWSQQAYLQASNPGADELFGASLALSADGSTLAVGARSKDSNTSGAGAVYVFTRVGTQWSQQAYVDASSTGAF